MKIPLSLHVTRVAGFFLLGVTALASGGARQGDLRPAGLPQASVELDPLVQPARPFLRFELPPRPATLLGQPVEFHPHEIWRPMCSVPASMTLEELQTLVLQHQALVESAPKTLANAAGNDAGLDIVYVVSGSIPSGALAALAASEAYIESFFGDMITVTIDVSFQPLQPGVLGGTSSSSGYVSYAGTRSLLQSDMDASDSIQAWLPSGSTCPVRYTSGSSVTNETRVFFNFANYKAADGTVGGTDANMTFNSNFAFDYDPSDGVPGSQYSFQDVVIHETGHALGFTCGGDFRFRDMDVLDLFRFQRTDGSGDYNPDSLSEFQVRARLVAYNAPNDDHNSDLISAEYRMADGSPYQMSHFREQVQNIGLMDPALAAGETWWPAFFSTADVAMFDAIGYDY